MKKKVAHSSPHCPLKLNQFPPWPGYAWPLGPTLAPWGDSRWLPSGRLQLGCKAIAIRQKSVFWCFPWICKIKSCLTVGPIKVNKILILFWNPHLQKRSSLWHITTCYNALSYFQLLCPPLGLARLRKSTPPRRTWPWTNPSPPAMDRCQPLPRMIVTWQRTCPLRGTTQLEHFDDNIWQNYVMVRCLLWSELGLISI